MATVRRKALAYITSGDMLLVFSHPDYPEAGIQVPAGTIEEGEPPAEAALREAREETGLTALTLVSFLGEQMYDRSALPLRSDEIHQRFFYHLACEGTPPATWRHYETHRSDGGTEAIAFDFFWARLPDGVPELIAGQGALLPVLIARLAQER